jgi:hypothetical protein
MLSALLGSKNIEKILYFLLINERGYGTQLHRYLNTPLTPIQKGFAKLERAGVLQSFYEGKTRFYRFNPVYPLKQELEQFLRKGYELLTPQEKRLYHISDTHPLSRAPLTFKQSQDALLLCWNRLKGVKMLMMNAKLHREAAIKRGKGDVCVTEESPSVLLFQENGHWQVENESEIQFSNVLRWSLDVSSGMISLEHLRPSAAKPIFLFHLKPKRETLIASIDSHLCGSDAYFGQVELGPHFLQLSWRIVGPKKNDRIECLYL